MVGLKVTVEVPDADAMLRLGARLARLLRAGDLVLFRGQLGAGKTTLAQGVGDGLGVRGPVTSPTFVIARLHPSLSGGPPLVHVDAYRLGGWAELEDLDLEATLDEAVTVVEWGEGFVEGLASDRLEVHIDRPHPADPPHPADHATSVRHAENVPEVRTVTIAGIGPRWQVIDPGALLGSA